MRMLAASLATSLCLCACSDTTNLGANRDASTARDGRAPALLRTDECGNGLDDDGNGRVDDGCPCGPGETQSCFSGLVASRGVGTCTDGVQTCSAAGREWGDWGSAPCVGETSPAAEQCDGMDHDCDGAPDEGCPCTSGATQECGVEFLLSPCMGGTQTCSASGEWSGCEGAVGPMPDLCDGIDNDCDGTADVGCGCVPAPELCRDGRDNDCDGEIDEIACTPDWPSDAGVPTDACGGPEVCADGLDNDCDGATDEGCMCAEMHCSWEAEPSMGTPLVIDLDGDRHAEIVIATISGRLVALRGTDCSEYWAAPLPPPSAGSDVMVSHLAAGDLDGDRRPEIVAGGAVFNAAGAQIGTVSMPAYAHWSAPAIAELDGVAPPEVVGWGRGRTSSLQGVVAWEFVGGNLQQRWHTLFVPSVLATFTTLPIVADIDGDGVPEVLTGNRIFDGRTGADETPPALATLGAGWPALARFSGSGPEIVVVGDREVYGFDLVTGALSFGPIAVGSEAGPPTIADFDGDGRPEIGVPSNRAFDLLDPDCRAGTPGCAGPGLRWSRPNVDTSGISGAAAFDLDGDGAAEVVYRDECFLRIYDGATGTSLFATTMTSGTSIDTPVVADVSGDGTAELVVTANRDVSACPAVDPDTGTLFAGAREGVFVFRGGCGRWSDARPIWNQHSYHGTNVNDDGTIPNIEAPSWSAASENNYRAGSRP